MARKHKPQTQQVKVHRPNQTAHTIPLEYNIPKELDLQYVDNLSIAHTETEFVVSYFQSQLPSIMVEEDWQKVRKIESKCVARIVFSPAKMPLFIDAMVRNWNRFLENYGARDSEDVSAGNDTEAADAEPEG